MLCEELTAHTIKRFIKDFQLPFPVALPQYLHYYIDLFDDVYKTKDKYRLLVDIVNKYGGNEPLYEYASTIRQNIEETIKSRESYQKFNSFRYSMPVSYFFQNNIPNNQLYKTEYADQRFTSIDLSKANYQALKYYSRYIAEEEDNEDNLILGTHSFDEFIILFTQDEYFKQAKKFREVLFGYMNPKRQSIFQKILIEKITKYCIDNHLFEISDIIRYDSDEIILKDYIDTSKIQKFADDNDIDIHISFFTLRQLKPYNYYVKENNDGTCEFKCIGNDVMPQCYKYYFSKEITDNDLIFMANNNMLAKYLEPLCFDKRKEN